MMENMHCKLGDGKRYMEEEVFAGRDTAMALVPARNWPINDSTGISQLINTPSGVHQSRLLLVEQPTVNYVF